MGHIPEHGGSRALLSRRHILSRAGAGFGLLGLAGLLQSEGLLGAAGGRAQDRKSVV